MKYSKDYQACTREIYIFIKLIIGLFAISLTKSRNLGSTEYRCCRIRQTEKQMLVWRALETHLNILKIWLRKVSNNNIQNFSKTHIFENNQNSFFSIYVSSVIEIYF